MAEKPNLDVREHARRRFNEHCPGATGEDVLAAIAAGEDVSPALAAAVTARARVHPGRYVASEDGRGMFVVHGGVVVTYLRLANRARELLAAKVAPPAGPCTPILRWLRSLQAAGCLECPAGTVCPACDGTGTWPRPGVNPLDAEAARFAYRVHGQPATTSWTLRGALQPAPSTWPVHVDVLDGWGGDVMEVLVCTRTAGLRLGLVDRKGKSS